MTIDKIREQLSIEISESLEWENKLDNSSPGHYGVLDSNVSLSEDDIWVDVPTRTFTFKNAIFDFDLMLGESNDGSEASFSRPAKGKGIFNFENSNKVVIEKMNLEFNLDLFAEE